MTVENILVPPIKTQGIKTKSVPLIKSLADIGKDTLWIEPFMGSAVVGLNVAGRRAVFADINPHVICFYNLLKERLITSVSVRSFLEEHGARLAERGADYYLEVRERFNVEHNPMDFLFLNRCCFNGMVRFNGKGKFNVPFCHKPQRFSKAYVTKVVNQVRRFEERLAVSDWGFVCQPFEETVAMANGDSFVYCDPPYIGRNVDYYGGWDEGSERKLKECLDGCGARYMVSTWVGNEYRTNPFVESVWGDCRKVTREHFYHVGARETNRGTITEALLLNY